MYFRRNIREELDKYILMNVLWKVFSHYQLSSYSFSFDANISFAITT